MSPALLPHPITIDLPFSKHLVQDHGEFPSKVDRTRRAREPQQQETRYRL